MQNVFAANLVGALQRFVNRGHLETELELAFGDAGDVEQIVDQARFQFHVAPDDGERLAHFGIVRCARFQFADHRDDRRKRIAQFVREQGQKLIFGRVRRDQFLAQPHVARLVFHQEKHALHGLLESCRRSRLTFTKLVMPARSTSGCSTS